MLNVVLEKLIEGGVFFGDHFRVIWTIINMLLTPASGFTTSLLMRGRKRKTWKEEEIGGFC